MKEKVIKILKKYTIILVLIGLILFFSIINPVFFSLTNFTNIFVQQSYVIIAAIGLAFVMISGGMDLSVGYQMSLVGVITAVSMMWLNLPVLFSVLIGLAMGVLLGIINGVAAVKLKVHPLIITLGTMTIFQGTSYIISNSNPIFGLPDSFKFLGQGYVGPIPFSVIAMVIVAFFASFVLNKTYFGRYVYALGSNEEAAHLAGVNTKKIKICVFMICGFFVALSAIILVGRAGSATSATGVGTEFTCMTAAVLGGISFKGGSGKVWGVITGVLILGVLSSGMQIIGLGTYPQYIAKGIVLLAAVGFDNYQKNTKIKKTEKAVEA
ncbi:ribose transport system permease protein/inositol transport system permease protein [Kineothrix alysoides]|uniref:Ribose transport system permease protein/inositol transport system permease protein n=1 Tax=Kineothrix alysoides TaxID=1469948 RepID=A0A4R1QR38_9FIRM|nr:ABC transporter permease [Kineothrix alysoides]TCL56258.1 ribose transport system permease protein/inositol transport system permease protein [Kineothrix alysoides]